MKPGKVRMKLKYFSVLGTTLLLCGAAYAAPVTLVCNGEFSCYDCKHTGMEIADATAVLDASNKTLSISGAVIDGDYLITSTSDLRYAISGKQWDVDQEQNRKVVGSLNRYTGKLILHDDSLITGTGKLKWHLGMICKKASRKF